MVLDEERCVARSLKQCKLGIHSYLSYLRDRLVVARDLLTKSGSIFVQIGDENVHLVRCVLDEVFGSENFIARITFRVYGMRLGLFLDSITDNILWYSRVRDHAKYRQLYLPGRQSKDEEPVRLYRPGFSQGLAFEYQFADRKYKPPPNMHWATGPDGLKKLEIAGRLVAFKSDMRFKRRVDDFPWMRLTTTWDDTWGEPEKLYAVQTNTKVIERCILMTTDPGDPVLDPTCGSGTTAYVAEKWGRRWITIDTSRVALALARTRLMTAKYPYYLLADSPEGLLKEEEITGKVPLQAPTQNDVRKGFVYKRVPHVTLKSIANNPDIKEGITREEIDAAIARHAETELLYDQPHEDPKRIRVTGPFTVESLSPHRTLSTEQVRPDTEEAAETEAEAGEFDQQVIEHLRKNKVQTGIKGWSIAFDRLDAYAGEWLQVVGEFREADGTVRTAAVSIGPKYGTLTREQVKEAAKEAVEGIGHDVLLVCGLAFNPDVSEEAKLYGKREC